MTSYLNNIESLEILGFERFRTKAELFVDSSMIPKGKGVYLVLNYDTSTPFFLKKGTGGYFKLKDPNVSLAELKKNWVLGTLVVYVGKATSLKSRLKQYLALVKVETAVTMVAG